MVSAVISSLLGLTLVVAGVSKFRDLEAHARVVVGYKVMPDTAARSLGKLLPFIEVALGAAVLLRAGLPWVGYGAAVLFLGYAAGLVVNLARGRTELACGCFAFGEENAPHITWFHPVRAVFFAALGIASAVLSAPVSAGDVVAGIAVSALIVGLAFAAAAFLAILRPGRIGVDTYLASARDELVRRRAALR
ncbi:MauE/DoxX family redox-associated membrane protein [Corynebacterium variabile]|uniref:MauE/DoxX family redox-associated membrane protein n=1 Tax=Corynebacterium variabile TaxID=1727 RepID=UPI0028A9427E|nr:MauE/DoxX family redox-associated membrane protein [Corynebacterium variabile]